MKIKHSTLKNIVRESVMKVLNEGAKVNHKDINLHKKEDPDFDYDREEVWSKRNRRYNDTFDRGDDEYISMTNPFYNELGDEPHKGKWVTMYMDDNVKIRVKGDTRKLAKAEYETKGMSNDEKIDYYTEHFPGSVDITENYY